jgi:hypothetical protein
MNDYKIKVIWKDGDNKEMTMVYCSKSTDLESAIQEVTTVVNERIAKYNGTIVSIEQDFN